MISANSAAKHFLQRPYPLNPEVAVRVYKSKSKKRTCGAPNFKILTCFLNFALTIPKCIAKLLKMWFVPYCTIVWIRRQSLWEPISSPHPLMVGQILHPFLKKVSTVSVAVERISRSDTEPAYASPMQLIRGITSTLDGGQDHKTDIWKEDETHEWARHFIPSLELLSSSSEDLLSSALEAPSSCDKSFHARSAEPCASFHRSSDGRDVFLRGV